MWRGGLNVCTLALAADVSFGFLFKPPLIPEQETDGGITR